jgi:hypothetical protein
MERIPVIGINAKYNYVAFGGQLLALGKIFLISYNYSNGLFRKSGIHYYLNNSFEL